MADAHANLPALKAALSAISAEECDAIFHVGDAIAIGPYPAECVDLLRRTPNLKCIVGNHEQYFVNGLPKPLPDWMSDGELQHQLWTHKQLGVQRRSIMAKWPFSLEEEFEGTKTVFVHYGLTSSGDDFADFALNPTVCDLDVVFAAHPAEIVFFGHDHASYDMEGKARYINPGSLGCNPHAIAGYTTAKFEDGKVNIQHHIVTYDDKELFEAFEDRQVPEREFIYKAFFGGRFEP